MAQKKPVLLLVDLKYWVLMVGVVLVLIIAMHETKDTDEMALMEGISGGAEAQMSAGGGVGGGRDPYGLYGGGSGTIVPANAAYSNIDAYPSSGKISAGGQGYSPSAPSTPQAQPGVGHTGAGTDEAYRRYQAQQAYQAGLRAGQQQRRRWPWPLSVILG